MSVHQDLSSSEASLRDTWRRQERHKDGGSGRQSFKARVVDWIPFRVLASPLSLDSTLLWLAPLRVDLDLVKLEIGMLLRRGKLAPRQRVMAIAPCSVKTHRRALRRSPDETS